METPRLIIIVINPFYFRRKFLVIKEHKHQHIRLFDQIKAVDPVVSPVVIKGKIRHGNRSRVKMGEDQNSRHAAHTGRLPCLAVAAFSRPFGPSSPAQRVAARFSQ